MVNSMKIGLWCEKIQIIILMNSVLFLLYLYMIILFIIKRALLPRPGWQAYVDIMPKFSIILWKS